MYKYLLSIRLEIYANKYSENIKRTRLFCFETILEKIFKFQILHIFSV